MLRRVPKNKRYLSLTSTKRCSRTIRVCSGSSPYVALGWPNGRPRLSRLYGRPGPPSSYVHSPSCGGASRPLHPARARQSTFAGWGSHATFPWPRLRLTMALPFQHGWSGRALKPVNKHGVRGLEDAAQRSDRSPSTHGSQASLGTIRQLGRGPRSGTCDCSRAPVLHLQGREALLDRRGFGSVYLPDLHRREPSGSTCRVKAVAFQPLGLSVWRLMALTADRDCCGLPRRIERRAPLPCFGLGAALVAEPQPNRSV